MTPEGDADDDGDAGDAGRTRDEEADGDEEDGADVDRAAAPDAVDRAANPDDRAFANIAIAATTNSAFEPRNPCFRACSHAASACAWERVSRRTRSSRVTSSVGGDVAAASPTFAAASSTPAGSTGVAQSTTAAGSTTAAESTTAVEPTVAGSTTVAESTTAVESATVAESATAAGSTRIVSWAAPPTARRAAARASAIRCSSSRRDRRDASPIHASADEAVRIGAIARAFVQLSRPDAIASRSAGNSRIRSDSPRS